MWVAGPLAGRGCCPARLCHTRSPTRPRHSAHADAAARHVACICQPGAEYAQIVPVAGRSVPKKPRCGRGRRGRRVAGQAAAPLPRHGHAAACAGEAAVIGRRVCLEARPGPVGPLVRGTGRRAGPVAGPRGAVPRGDRHGPSAGTRAQEPSSPPRAGGCARRGPQDGAARRAAGSLPRPAHPTPPRRPRPRF